MTKRCFCCYPTPTLEIDELGSATLSQLAFLLNSDRNFHEKICNLDNISAPKKFNIQDIGWLTRWTGDVGSIPERDRVKERFSVLVLQHLRLLFRSALT